MLQDTPEDLITYNMVKNVLLLNLNSFLQSLISRGNTLKSHKSQIYTSHSLKLFNCINEKIEQLVVLHEKARKSMAVEQDGALQSICMNSKVL